MSYKDRAKQRKYQKDWAKSRRRAWLEAHGPCVRCGSKKELTVDHVDPTKKCDHKVWSWSEERRNEELAKCQVLCKDCHKLKTSGEQRKPLVHGTLSGYKHRGCRCPDCTKVATDSKNRWRAERKRISAGWFLQGEKP
jgi:5-methylcytosine-specific restriction endonuclease McrA